MRHNFPVLFECVVEMRMGFNWKEKWRRKKKAVGRRMLLLRSMSNFTFASLVFALLLERTNAQSYFGHCYSKLGAEDINSDGVLSQDEFSSFMAAYTADAIELPLPGSLLEPYTTAASEGVVSIAGIQAADPAEKAPVMQLCHQVKNALMSHYQVVVEWDSCIGALKVGDQGPPSGFLGPEEEYLSFLGSLTGVEYTSPQSIPSLVKAAYDDMAVDGMIAGPKGGEYLMEFCQRVSLASRINESKPAVTAETAAPTGTPVSPLDSITEAPTNPPSMSVPTEKKTPLAQVSASPKANFELTEEKFQACLKDILLSDINRNDLLERKEYTRLVNRLHNKVFHTDIHAYAVDGIEAAFKAILQDQGKRVAPSIKGSKPGQKPSRAEAKMLRFICKTSHEVIRNEHRVASGDGSANGTEVDGEATPDDDFARFFRKCKVSLFVSDRDRDSKLNQEEFAALIGRLKPEADAEFRDLDEIFQRTFRLVSAGGSIKVTGSSPASKPTLTQIAHLQTVCKVIKTGMSEYDLEEAKSESSSHLQVRNKNLGDQFPNLSEEFFRTCTMGMFIADRDRDSRLSSEEFFNFVERLTFGDINAHSYEELHPLFQATQDTYSDIDGFIDVKGTKPGSSVNYDEEKALRRICNGLDGAIADITEEMAQQSAEADDTETPVKVEPESKVQKEEAKSLGAKKSKPMNMKAMNMKAMNSKPQGVVQSQSMKKKTSQSMKNVQAMKKSQAKQKNINKKKKKMEESIEYVVSDTFKSLKIVKLPAPPEMSYTKFSKCKKTLRQADSDGFKDLDPVEYYEFMSALGNFALDAKSFDQLPETLVTPFREFSVDNKFVRIDGTGVGQEVSVSEMEHLQAFCASAFAAIHFMENPLSEEQDCISSMVNADEDRDTWLTETEYVDFLNIWTKHRLHSVSFDELSYFLRANFGWGKSFNGKFQVLSKGLSSAHYSDLRRLENICERLGDALSQRTPSSTLSDHCRKSVLASDLDRDGFMGKREFMSLVSVFTDRLWQPSQRFMAIHPVLRAFFEEVESTEGMIDVQDVKMGGSSLDEFCEGFAQAIDDSQRNQTRLDQCREALYLGDTNDDMHLSSNEFVDMLYGIILYPGLTDARPDGLGFNGLHDDVQASYRSSIAMNGGVDLNGLFAPDLTDENEERLDFFCEKLYNQAVPRVLEEEVKIYNAFLVSLDGNFTNSNVLSGYRKRVMNEAYRRFVYSATSSSATGVTETGRKLVVVGATPHSTKVYNMSDVDCPDSYEATASCQKVYASFQAITVSESNPQDAALELSSKTQRAIDNGDLQKEVIALDPEFPTKVLRSSFPLTPDETMALEKSLGDRESIFLQAGSVLVLSLSGLFAVTFVIIGLYYGRRLKKRAMDDVMNNKIEDDLALLGQYHREDDDSVGDDDDMKHMTKEEKKKLRREKRLRQSIVPLLLAQSYVSCLNDVKQRSLTKLILQHLPDYNYGEDLFQYTYNHHPVLGLLWHHPLHPIGFQVRVICLVGSVCFGFAMSNIIYLSFEFSGWEFDSNYFEVAAEKIAVTGRDVLDDEIEAAASTFTTGNIAVWTIGALFHALFDASLWSMATCSCMAQDSFVEKMERYSRLGTLAVLTYVIGVAVVACVSAGVRVVWMADEETDYTPSSDFLMSMTVEVVTAFFFYYPLFSFIMFSGILSCLSEDLFGGRRQEMLIWERNMKRELRSAQRKKVLESLTEPHITTDNFRDDYQYPGDTAYDHTYPIERDYAIDNGIDRPPAFIDAGSESDCESTCHEMEFQPRFSAIRRHSFGGESVSEREPVHRKWQDDLDTGSVVSAWSKSSWAKYGYNDWGETIHDRDPDRSRNSSSLSCDENIPDNMLVREEDPFTSVASNRRKSRSRSHGSLKTAKDDRSRSLSEKEDASESQKSSRLRRSSARKAQKSRSRRTDDSDTMESSTCTNSGSESRSTRKDLNRKKQADISLGSGEEFDQSDESSVTKKVSTKLSQKENKATERNAETTSRSEDDNHSSGSSLSESKAGSKKTKNHPKQKSQITEDDSISSDVSSEFKRTSSDPEKSERAGKRKSRARDKLKSNEGDESSASEQQSSESRAERRQSKIKPKKTREITENDSSSSEEVNGTSNDQEKSRRANSPSQERGKGSNLHKRSEKSKEREFQENSSSEDSGPSSKNETNERERPVDSRLRKPPKARDEIIRTEFDDSSSSRRESGKSKKKKSVVIQDDDDSSSDTSLVSRGKKRGKSPTREKSKSVSRKTGHMDVEKDTQLKRAVKKKGESIGRERGKTDSDEEGSYAIDDGPLVVSGRRPSTKIRTPSGKGREVFGRQNVASTNTPRRASSSPRHRPNHSPGPSFGKARSQPPSRRASSFAPRSPPSQNISGSNRRVSYSETLGNARRPSARSPMRSRSPFNPATKRASHSGDPLIVGSARRASGVSPMRSRSPFNPTTKRTSHNGDPGIVGSARRASGVSPTRSHSPYEGVSPQQGRGRAFNPQTSHQARGGRAPGMGRNSAFAEPPNNRMSHMNGGGQANVQRRNSAFAAPPNRRLSSMGGPQMSGNRRMSAMSAPPAQRVPARGPQYSGAARGQAQFSHQGRGNTGNRRQSYAGPQTSQGMSNFGSGGRGRSSPMANRRMSSFSPGRGGMQQGPQGAGMGMPGRGLSPAGWGGRNMYEGNRRQSTGFVGSTGVGRGHEQQGPPNWNQPTGRGGRGPPGAMTNRRQSYAGNPMMNQQYTRALSQENQGRSY